jgi:DNA-binding PadR family transcriptional regulator
MSDCDRVLERLYECRDSGKHLELHDFVDLGLSNSVIGECLERLDRLGWAYARVHWNKRDNRGIDRIVAQITDEGKREFERSRPVG